MGDTDATLAGGEQAAGLTDPAAIAEAAPRHLRLLSGKLFRLDVKANRSYTSGDGGENWVEGGLVNPYVPHPDYGSPVSMFSGCLADVHIQIQNGPHQGRIVIPYYLEMDGQHPDYTRKQCGGYAIWKGKQVLLETHTHIPEMAGAYMCFSDDEGGTWRVSQGFIMGYIGDGHQGLWSCEEPTIAELKDGRLLCFIRSATGRVLKSYSCDGGETWTKVEVTDIPMSNSPGVLIRLPKTGDLAFVWNPMTPEEIKRGYRRGRLTVAVSTDDGETWRRHKTLALSPGVSPHRVVAPGPLEPMVRGPEQMGVIPEGFRHYHYPQVYVDDATIYIYYLISTPAAPPDDGPRTAWIAKPLAWLYEDAET